MKKTLQLLTLLTLSISLFADEVKQGQSKSEMYKEELKRLREDYKKTYIAQMEYALNNFKIALNQPAISSLQEYSEKISQLNIPRAEKRDLIYFQQILTSSIDEYQILEQHCKDTKELKGFFSNWFASEEQKQHEDTCQLLRAVLLINTTASKINFTLELIRKFPQV